MAERDDFLNAICANPDDDGPRLIFADWLEDQSDHMRAEFIRGQCELAHLTRFDPRFTILARRLRSLEKRHGAEWRAELTPLDGIVYGAFERGFVAAIEARDVGAFRRHFPRVLEMAPIRRLSLKHLPDVADLARSRTMQHVVILDLHGHRIGPAGAAQLALGPHRQLLRELRLLGCLIHDEGVTALTEVEWPALTSLDLGTNDLTDAACERLSRSALWTQLRVLHLDHNEIGNRGAEQLARRAVQSCLRELNLEANFIENDGAAALADADWSDGPPRIELRHNLLSRSEAERLRLRPGAHLRM